ncbi:unnamed protein product [Linum trigynum]|uniref:Uncharacterized protein n=1 Tax=Linum trigynum TaxID=586398 RepID=A0AAV2C6C5_9ROSI
MIKHNPTRLHFANNSSVYVSGAFTKDMIELSSRSNPKPTARFRCLAEEKVLLTKLLYYLLQKPPTEQICRSPHYQSPEKAHLEVGTCIDTTSFHILPKRESRSSSPQISM